MNKLSVFKADPQQVMRTVIFDLDGTLVDNFSAIARSVNYAQRKLRLPESSLETVKAAVGGGYKRTLQRLFGSDLAAKAEPHFLEFFNAHLLEDIRVLSGVCDLIQSLHERGKQMAVLTNKQGDAARRILRHIGMDEHMNVILGTGDTPYRKPDPNFTHALLDKLGAKPEDCLFIGDSPYDFEAADNVNMPCCLVTTGSHTAEQLSAETGCKNIFASFEDLARNYPELEPEHLPA